MYQTGQQTTVQFWIVCILFSLFHNFSLIKKVGKNPTKFGLYSALKCSLQYTSRVFFRKMAIRFSYLIKWTLFPFGQMGSISATYRVFYRYLKTTGKNTSWLFFKSYFSIFYLQGHEKCINTQLMDKRKYIFRRSSSPQSWIEQKFILNSNFNQT